ncbi:MAG: UDP-N-acetylglucosamine pyrophosphorylase [Clostridia bacterium]|nr:UDP-N-acetylglucosamine pyrophosphorylase [Clostridia bacterium]
MAIPKIDDLLTLSHTLAAPLFEGKRYPWEILPELKDFIRKLGATLSPEEYDEVSPEVWVHKTARVAPSALIAGPTVIGAGTEVRHCAFIRGSALVGEGCVVGNSTEIKNAVVFDGVQIPHYNYVGDSILGFRSHMGAGVVASNFRSDKGNVNVHDGNETIETGLRKLGAILGDGSDVGCNSVLCPGSVVGRDCIVYPLSRVRGYLPERSIFKGDGVVVPRKI